MSDSYRGPLSYETDIPDRVAFGRFLAALAEDLRKNPEGWARVDLEGYLRAMADWTLNGLVAFNRNMRSAEVPDPPTWRIFADILGAARVIED